MLQLPLSCPLNKGSGESSSASPPVSWHRQGVGCSFSAQTQLAWGPALTHLPQVG